MTTIRHNDKEITFGMWDTFELHAIVDEFNRKHQCGLALSEGQKRKA